MVHTSLEETLERHCPNCGEEHHAKFFSLFVGEMHYIIGDCNHCGYRIEFRADEFGAGLFLPDGNPAVKTTFAIPSLPPEREVVVPLREHRLLFHDDEPIREERERH